MRALDRIQGWGFVRSFHLHRSKKQDWIDAFYWLISTVFAGLMPVWFPILFLALFSLTPSFRSFTRNGEFALFSASVVSASLYIVTKDSRWNFLKEAFGERRLPPEVTASFPNQRLFIYIAGFLTFISTIIYMGALVARTPDVNLQLNEGLVHMLQLILLAVTLLISFLVTVVENAFTNRIDLQRIREEDLEDLDRDFEALPQGES